MLSTVFHCGRACTLRERHAGGCGAQRLDVLLEGVRELRVHVGPTDYAADFVERYIFTLDGGGSPGRGSGLLCLCGRTNWSSQTGS
jgi:hypothetical protein